MTFGRIEVMYNWIIEKKKGTKMNEDIERVCELLKKHRKTNKSILAKLTNILPIIRIIDSSQEESIKLSRALQARLKKLDRPEKEPDLRIALLKEVVLILEPATLKKRDLVAKLKEKGVRLPSSFALILSIWRKAGAFEESQKQGWYEASPKGRSMVGLPPKPYNPEESVTQEESPKELEVEKEIASLREKLQKVEAELASARSKIARREIKLAKAARQRQLSQRDLAILGLYEARPGKLKRNDVKLLLEKKGKTPTKNSLTFLLTNIGSNEMIASSGEWGNKDFSLTQKGEERAKKLFESQPCGEKSSEPVPPAEPAPPPQKEEVKVEPQQPQPCVEKVPEPKLAVEEGPDGMR